MPPTKGGAVVAKKQKQTTLPFKAVKLNHSKAKRGRFKGRLNKHDESLMKLRIPHQLCKLLPSVKKFNNVSMKKLKLSTGGQENMPAQSTSVKSEAPQLVFGAKRKRGEQQKYRIQLLHEARLKGMIWDMAFCPDGHILVALTQGIILCDGELNKIKQLETVVLPGGIGFLHDGTIVIVCRHFDTVNFFSSEGKFLRSFPAGHSPQGLAINSKEELIVSDNGEKEVRIYDKDGQVLRTIAHSGSYYTMKWPLYVAVTRHDDIIISDCHAQKVFVFNVSCEFRGEFPLRTSLGNQVLRPHGLCVGADDDVFIVDTAVDSLEVFRSDGSFMQTLLLSEEGVKLKLKLVAVNDKYLAIGGMTGLVRVYKFMTEDQEKAYLIKKEFSVKKEPNVKSDEVIVLD
jgi:hypothetical protein